MSPQYKLTYFNIKAVGEPVRYILSHAKVDWEDHRVPYPLTEDYTVWLKLKPNTAWGVLPILEESDGRQVSQSRAIIRYLGRKHGLGGSNDWENAKCDEYLDAANDMKTETTKANREGDPVRKAEVIKNSAEVVLPTGWKRFSEILKKNGTGYLVGDKLTYADIVVAHYFEFLSGVSGTADKMGDYPELQDLHKKVMNQPGIKEWIQKRPETL